MKKINLIFFVLIGLTLLFACKKKEIESNNTITLELNQGYNFATKKIESWGVTTDLWYTDHLGSKFLEGKKHLEDLGNVDFEKVTYPYNTTWRNYWTPYVDHVYGLELDSESNKHVALKVLEISSDSSYVKIKYKYLN